MSKQIRVKIMPRIVRDKNHLYATINLDAMNQAMNILRGEHFKLWLYLNKNQEGYEFDLSQKACEAWGIKKDTYHKAKASLVEAGYLVSSDGSHFQFYEFPQSQNQTLKSEIQTEESEIQTQVIGKSEFQTLNEESEIQTKNQKHKSQIQTLEINEKSEIQTLKSEKTINSDEFQQTNNTINNNTNIIIHGEVSRGLVESCFIDYQIDEDKGLVYYNNKIFKLV